MLELGQRKFTQKSILGAAGILLGDCYAQVVNEPEVNLRKISKTDTHVHFFDLQMLHKLKILLYPKPVGPFIKGQLYLCLLTIGMLTFFSCSKQQTEFYLSPTGNDKNSGSKTQPFANLERARDAIRDAKDNNEESSNLVFKVYLREGDYSISSSFMLDERDSGTDSIPV